MDKKEIIGKLTELVQGGVSKSNIERDCQLPKNSLSSVLTGVKEMPNKWVEKFGGYFQKLEVDPSDHAVFDTEKIKARIQELGWVEKVEFWCKAKGFSPSELIEKFEGLERRANAAEVLLKKTQLENGKLYGENLRLADDRNNPLINAARGRDTSGVNEDENKSKTPTKELSPFLKSRQALKNNQK